MKNIIQLLFIVFSLTAVNAQFKYPTTTNKSYKAPNKSNSKKKNYSNPLKKTTYSIPVSYNPEIYSDDLPNEANKKIIQLLPKGIQSFSFAKNGGWVIITKNNEYHEFNAPKQCTEKVKAFIKSGHQIKQVSFHPKKNNSFVIVTDKTTYARGISSECNSKIKSLQKKGKKIKNVSFGYKTKETWVIINTDGSFYANNVSNYCYDILKNNFKHNNASAKLSSVSFSPDGGWVVLADGVFIQSGFSNNLYKELNAIQKKRYRSDIITFMPNKKSWSVVANTKFTRSVSAETSILRKMSTTSIIPIKKNSYTSGDGIKGIRKWVLKVTLDYFYCDESDDSDNKDDYILNQWVLYTDKNNNNIKKIGGKMKINNSSQINTNKQTLDYRHIVGNNIIIKGDNKHQFWVEEGKRKKIGNYILFEITEELLNDRNSRFIIYTSLVERSDSSGGLLTIGSFPGAGIDMSGSGEKLIDIKKVITDLAKLNTLKPGLWKAYGYSSNMKMRKYNSNSKDLYGYINFWDNKLDRKAKAMMRFELVGLNKL